MTSNTPGPIPIARNNSDGQKSGPEVSPLARGGNSGSYLGLSASLGGSNSFREAMAVSFGKDVADLLEYSIGRFGSSTDSEATIAPSSARIDSTFCRNFTCCGRALDDLHDLLQHYEECHVCFEDDEMPAMVADDGFEEDSSPGSDTGATARSAVASVTASPPASPHGSRNMTGLGAAADLKRVRPLGAANTAGPNTMVTPSAEDLDSNSAFDTAVMLSPSVNRGRKRAFGTSPNPSGGINVQQSLHRALVDGGLGRRQLSMNGVYTPSSPFSTPGSSRPGTPSHESENEAFFGSTTQASVFSNLSLRNNNVEDQQLPSCAPPNLFFPSATSTSDVSGSVNASRPMKRERYNTENGSTSATSSPGNPLTKPTQPASSLADAATAEHRPYKCPAPGCDKAYKQMNGLKYHRLHGHCNQNLRNVGNDLTGADASQEKASDANSAMPKTSNDAAASLAGLAGSGQRSTSLGPDLRAFGIEMTGNNATTSGAGQDCASPSKAGAAAAQQDKTYVCQVGNCDKRYKNLNGLRYHYLHSGSHGLLGLQLLHANGGGASARADGVSGRPPVSTDTLSREQIVQAAAAAQALLNQQAQAQSAKTSNVTASADANALASSSAFLAAAAGSGSAMSGQVSK